MEYPKTARSTEEFLVCTELLPAIRKRYGPTFALLEIPEILRSDGKAGEYGTVYFRDYVGEKYNDRWNKGNGGGPLGTELSLDMVQLLKDLQEIDVDWLLSQHPVGKSVQRSAFDLQGWLLSFQKQKALALSMGISDNESTQAKEFISGGFKLTSRIVSNGDFYPRNLIKLPNRVGRVLKDTTNRVALVDWGYWPGYRACFVDYLVNVGAFAFIHMWGNALWQKEFVRHLRETFDINLHDLRKAILIKSFEQAMFWTALPQLAQVQVNLFKMALKDEIFG